MNKFLMILFLFLMISCQKGESTTTNREELAVNGPLTSRQIQRCLEKKFKVVRYITLTSDQFIEALKNSKEDCHEGVSDLEKFFSRLLKEEEQEILLLELQKKLNISEELP